MYYTKLNPITNCVFSEENVYALKKTNGLCYNCNRNQELMVLQLASFMPDNEENFDDEVQQYQRSLEKSYRLCAQCERVVKRSLNQVKRHFVGSKMSKIGERLQATNDVPAAKKMRVIKIASYSIFIITLINFYMALSEVNITGEKLIELFGLDIAGRMLIVISYVLAVKALLMEIVLQTLNNPILQDTFLYLTTVVGLVRVLTGDFDWNCFLLLDVKEFFNIFTMLATLMVLILSNRQHLGSQIALLFFCSFKTLLDNHEKLVEPIEIEFLHKLDFICIVVALVLSYRGIRQAKLTFKYGDDLNRSFHKICLEVEEDSEQELDETFFSDSCSNLLNSSLKSQTHEFGKNGSFYGEKYMNGYSRTPSVISASFKSPTELNCSRLSSKQQVIDNVGKFTRLNITKSLNTSTPRNFDTSMNNPFYSHLNLDRQTPTSVLSYRAHAIISPPKLNRDPVSEASWVAGGFWTTSPKKSAPPPNSDFMPIMSRTSSQSSGFESQAGIGSRENSVEKNTDPQMTINIGIRPIRPHPLYPGQVGPSINSNSPFQNKNQSPLHNTFAKPLLHNYGLSTSRLSLASRQSNRSLFGEPTNFNDTSSLYSYRSNGRFVAPISPHNHISSSRSIFNFKKFSTDLPHL